MAKSMMGYAVAFVVAIIVYRFVIEASSRCILAKTRNQEPSQYLDRTTVGFDGFFVEPVADSGFGQYFCLCTPSSAVLDF